MLPNGQSYRERMGVDRKRRGCSDIVTATASRLKLTSSADFRVVHGDKELFEKLGRNDPCPCSSGRRFQEVLHAEWAVRRCTAKPLRKIE
jgi:hypothetical protein